MLFFYLIIKLWLTQSKIKIMVMQKVESYQLKVAISVFVVHPFKANVARALKLSLLCLFLFYYCLVLIIFRLYGLVFHGHVAELFPSPANTFAFWIEELSINFKALWGEDARTLRCTVHKAFEHHCVDKDIFFRHPISLCRASFHVEHEPQLERLIHY